MNFGKVVRRALGAAFTLVLILGVSLSTPSAAQSLVTTTSSSAAEAIPALPEPLTEAAVNALISRLSDTQVRQLLLDQLNTQAVPEAEAAADLSEFRYHATTGALGQIKIAIERIPLMLTSQVKAFANFGNFLGVNGLLSLAGYMLMVVAGALVIEMIFRRATAQWLTLPEVAEANPTLRQTLLRLFARLTSQVAAVGVFVFAANSITVYAVPEYYHPFIMLVGPMLIGLPRLALAVGRFFMAPDNPAYRIVYADDDTAKAMVFHSFWFAFLVGFGYVILPFNMANGVPMGETRLGFWITLSVFFVFGNRHLAVPCRTGDDDARRRSECQPYGRSHRPRVPRLWNNGCRQHVVVGQYCCELRKIRIPRQWPALQDNGPDAVRTRP